MSVASKTDNRIDVYNIISKTAELLDWIRIKNVKQQNMVSYVMGNQRINIWIKVNNKITVRMQPRGNIQKDISVAEIIKVLTEFHCICQYSDEGQ